MTLSELFTKALKSILFSKFEGNVSEMARVTKIHRNQIDRYISGANSPSLASIDELAIMLKISPFELIGLEHLGSNPPRFDTDIHDTIEALQADVIQIKKALSELNIKADKCLGDIH